MCEGDEEDKQGLTQSYFCVEDVSELQRNIVTALVGNENSPESSSLQWSPSPSNEQNCLIVTMCGIPVHLVTTAVRSPPIVPVITLLQWCLCTLPSPINGWCRSLALRIRASHGIELLVSTWQLISWVTVSVQAYNSTAMFSFPISCCNFRLLARLYGTLASMFSWNRSSIMLQVGVQQTFRERELVDDSPNRSQLVQCAECRPITT